MSTGLERALANYAWMIARGRVPTRPGRPAELQLAVFLKTLERRYRLIALSRSVLARYPVPKNRYFLYHAWTFKLDRLMRMYTERVLERWLDIAYELGEYRGLDRGILEQIAGLLRTESSEQGADSSEWSKPKKTCGLERESAHTASC